MEVACSGLWAHVHAHVLCLVMQSSSFEEERKGGGLRTTSSPGLYP